jgi:outer membrane protein assembly factor BamB
MAYFAKGDGKLYGFRVDTEKGELAWTADLPARVRSSITVCGDWIYYGDDSGGVFARDRKTGELAWSHKLPKGVASTPWIADGVLYVGCEDGKVYAIE